MDDLPERAIHSKASNRKTIFLARQKENVGRRNFVHAVSIQKHAGTQKVDVRPLELVGGNSQQKP